MRERVALIDPVHRERFGNGKDPYKAMAAFVFNKAPEAVTKEERDRAKQAFFLMFTMHGPTILTNMIQGDEDE